MCAVDALPLAWRRPSKRARIPSVARLGSDERAFFFLGPARYVSHQGERPMKITWRLRHRLPGDLFASFAAAVA